jgi:hypothetical protein
MKDCFFKELENVFNKFPKYHMKTLVGDSAKVSKEYIFKLKIKDEDLYEISDDKVVNFASSKILTAKSTSSHHNSHKLTWPSPDRKTHNQVDNF